MSADQTELRALADRGAAELDGATAAELLAWVDTQRKVRLGYRPVHTYTLTKEVQYIEPKARVY